MGENRDAIGPFITSDRTAAVGGSALTVDKETDQYNLTSAAGALWTVTLDPNAVQGDQVIIKDASNNAGADNITINASAGQVIHRSGADGASYTLAVNSLAVRFTFMEWDGAGNQVNRWYGEALRLLGGG